METQRLTLRQWMASDKQPFSELNADPEVMKYFPSFLSEDESNTFADRIQSRITENGWGFWALELKETKAFIGFVGLNSPRVQLPFSPCVEIGWRLSRKHWGKGYATEAAQAALRYAFENLSLKEVVSFTSINNIPSQKVMRKIGLANCHQNFLHPSVPDGNALQEHVLFKINREEWHRIKREA